MIFTGDLADQGEPEAYAKLRAIVEPACKAMGAKVIWAMGNHDDRANFRAGLLDQAGNDFPVDHSYFVNGLRVITLDTSVPGYHHGELSDDQLDWLPAELATPAPDGTILALHHPPVPSVLDLAVLVELRGQAALAGVLRNSDVRAILAGHLHYSTTATFAGIPVSVASATCYTQDLNVAVGGTRGRDGGAGVQPGARLRTHDRALRGAARRHPGRRRVRLGRGSPAPARGRRDPHPGAGQAPGHRKVPDAEAPTRQQVSARGD